MSGAGGGTSARGSDANAGGASGATNAGGQAGSVSAGGSSGSAGESAGGASNAGSGGASGSGGTPVMRTMTEADLAPMRAACAFQAGADPALTIGTEYPVGTDIPINHVIVIMQENRSFDHYLGRLVAQGYYQKGDFSEGGSGFDHSDQLDGPPDGWALPDGSGNMIPPHADDEYCYGVDHSWDTQHKNWDNGKNDQFVIDNNPDGQRAMFYEDDTVIPFYYALANTFSVGDRYFCSVMTSTWPNRLYMMGATSYGIGDNSLVTVDTSDHPATQIFSLLEAAGHTWADYTDGPHQQFFYPYFGYQKATMAHYKNANCDLLSDITNGTLPDVSYFMGDEVSETSDEGPSNLPGIGGTVVENILRTLFASPSWKDTAVFIMYDENGGIADHVPPADACAPDALPPVDGNGTPYQGDFTKTGFRVPFIVVSPFTKAHYVSHVVHDHSSVVRFIEARFGIPAMTNRDANSAPPMEMFDFQNPPFLTPPNITQTTTVPQSVLTQCNQTLAPLCK